MVNYLARAGFLAPAYATEPGRRGRVRYYSYRDLVLARLIQRLREAGVELERLKRALLFLAGEEPWVSERSNPADRLEWLVTNGREVMLKSEDGFLDSFRPDRQRAFAFVVNLGHLCNETKERIPPPKDELFSLRLEPMIYPDRAVV